MNGITEIRTRGGMRVGYVIDGTYRKTIDSRRGHMLRKPPAIGFDMSTLQDAQRAGARVVCVEDSATGRNYWASMEMIFLKGFPQNRMAGLQQFLPLHRWRDDRDSAESAAADAIAEANND